MTVKFDELSLPFVMELARLKSNAEKRNDTAALTSLKNNYPELFSISFGCSPQMDTTAALTFENESKIRSLVQNFFTESGNDKKLH